MVGACRRVSVLFRRRTAGFRRSGYQATVAETQYALCCGACACVDADGFCRLQSRYIKGCQDSLAPMPNPEWYQEGPPLRPLYK